MVKFFQRIGMQFGPDANAHTSFAQTVYDVILPKGDMKSMGEGLLVLRDYAQGALLLEEELQRERNVILSEMRARDSAEFRTFKSVLGLKPREHCCQTGCPLEKKRSCGRSMLT
jgi:zinc protease